MAPFPGAELGWRAFGLKAPAGPTVQIIHFSTDRSGWRGFGQRAPQNPVFENLIALCSSGLDSFSSEGSFAVYGPGDSFSHARLCWRAPSLSAPGVLGT